MEYQVREYVEGYINESGEVEGREYLRWSGDDDKEAIEQARFYGNNSFVYKMYYTLIEEIIYIDGEEL